MFSVFRVVLISLSFLALGNVSFASDTTSSSEKVSKSVTVYGDFEGEKQVVWKKGMTVLDAIDEALGKNYSWEKVWRLRKGPWWNRKKLQVVVLERDGKPLSKRSSRLKAGDQIAVNLEPIAF